MEKVEDGALSKAQVKNKDNEMAGSECTDSYEWFVSTFWP